MKTFALKPPRLASQTPYEVTGPFSFASLCARQSYYKEARAQVDRDTTTNGSRTETQTPRAIVQDRLSQGFDRQAREMCIDFVRVGQLSEAEALAIGNSLDRSRQREWRQELSQELKLHERECNLWIAGGSGSETDPYRVTLNSAQEIIPLLQMAQEAYRNSHKQDIYIANSSNDSLLIMRPGNNFEVRNQDGTILLPFPGIGPDPLTLYELAVLLPNAITTGDGSELNPYKMRTYGEQFVKTIERLSRARGEDTYGYDARVTKEARNVQVKFRKP